MTDTQPENWSTTRIKGELRKHGVDLQGLNEKEELLERLKQVPEYSHIKVQKGATFESEHPKEPPMKPEDKPEEHKEEHGQQPHSKRFTVKKGAQHNIDDPDHPHNWNTHKIKEVLDSHNVDRSNCVEKEELLDLLLKLPEYKDYPAYHHHHDSHHKSPMKPEEKVDEQKEEHRETHGRQHSKKTARKEPRHHDHTQHDVAHRSDGKQGNGKKKGTSTGHEDAMGKKSEDQRA
jgi:hypothetical protein